MKKILKYFSVCRSHVDSHRFVFCLKCSKFVCKDSWGKHVCNLNKECFPCDECSYSTGRKDNLVRHIKTKHNNNSSSVTGNNNETGNNTQNIQQPQMSQQRQMEGPGMAVMGGSMMKQQQQQQQQQPVIDGNINNNISAVFHHHYHNNNNNITVPEEAGFHRNNNNNTAPGIDRNNMNDISLDEEDWDVIKRKKVRKIGLNRLSLPCVMMFLLTILSGCAGQIFLPPRQPMNEVPLDDEDWGWLGSGQLSAPRGPNVCVVCNYSAPSQKRLLRHMKKHEPKPMPSCKYECGYSVPKPSDVKKHELRCEGRPQVVRRLDADTIWEILSICPLSNNVAYKILQLLQRALNVTFLPKYFKKSQKDYLNSTYQFLKSEIVTFKVRVTVTHLCTNIKKPLLVVTHLSTNMFLVFQDINNEPCKDKSTLVTVGDLKKFVEKVCVARGVERPFLTVGLDGGQEKCIVVIQVNYFK